MRPLKTFLFDRPSDATSEALLKVRRIYYNHVSILILHTLSGVYVGKKMVWLQASNLDILKKNSRWKNSKLKEKTQ